MSITEASAGSFNYNITCTGAPPAASAQAAVNFTDKSITTPASGGKSGGGAFDPLSLVLLGLLLCRRLRRPEPAPAEIFDN